MRAWQAIAERHADAYLLIIRVDREEAGRRDPKAPTGDRVVYAGFISCFDGEAPYLFQCADLALAPYVDGLSTRRSSTISLMAHGLPIVSTRGELTDPGFFDDFPVPLIAPDDEAGFERAVETLIASREARAAAGEQAWRFFERHFAWEVLQAQFVQVAADAIGSNRKRA